MSRLAAIALSIVTCTAAAVVGAFAAHLTEFPWRVSAGSFNYTLNFSLIPAVIGVTLTAYFVALVPGGRIWQTFVVGTVVTLLATFAFSWWDVITSLG